MWGVAGGVRSRVWVEGLGGLACFWWGVNCGVADGARMGCGWEVLRGTWLVVRKGVNFANSIRPQKEHDPISCYLGSMLMVYFFEKYAYTILPRENCCLLGCPRLESTLKNIDAK